MKSKPQKQYTIRNIPPRMDHQLREEAALYGKSLNTAALEALSRGLGLEAQEVKHHDLDRLAGTWAPDPEFDRVIKEMDRVDEDLWK